MCLIIDVNTLSKVFDKSDVNHDAYRPVLSWIIEGRGKVVCGGSKYWEELKKVNKYLRVINQLNTARKVVKLPDGDVDEMMERLKGVCTDKDFDDPHIVALAIVSKVKIVCSEDERSYPYLTNKKWYPKGQGVPKIYRRSSSRSAKEMLSDKNIADICLPCEKLKKEMAASFQFAN